MRAKMLEGISPTVYHFTSLRNAYDIITTGEFKLSPSFSSDIEEKYSDNIFFLSTTRSRLGSYHTGNANGVLFELDGRRLAHNNKGKSIDYWGDLNKDSEFEDRIYSSSFTLPSKGTITGMEIVIGDNTSHPLIVKVAKFLYIYAKKNGIPCKVYHQMSGLKIRDHKDLYSHAEIMALNAEPEESLSYSQKQDFKTGTTPEKNDLYNFIQIYYNDYTKLNKEAKTLYTEIIRYPDTMNKLRASIKMATSSLRSEFTDKLLNRLGIILKKERASTFEELFSKISTRITKEDKVRQQKHREQIRINAYQKNKDQYDNVLDALTSKAEFKRELFHDDDYTAMMQLNKAYDTLDYLKMIPDDAKERWGDVYGGLAEHTFEFLFKIIPS